MGFFVTPAVIGGGTELMIANIIESNVSFLQWGFASALAVILLMVTVGLLFLSNKYIKLEDMLLGRQFLAGGGSQQITIGISGKAKRTRRLGILSVIRNWKDQYRFVRKFFTSLNCIATVLERASRPVIGFIVHNRQIFLRIVCGFVLFYLMLPVCIVLPMSFSSAEYLTFPPPSFSLKWYRSFFGDPMWLASAGRSMLIATLTMLLSITIAVPASFALVRHRFKWRSLAMVFILSPLVVPGIIVAIAIYFLHVRLHLIGTPIAVVLGHTIRGICCCTHISNASGVR
jgi:putative spermidine/putrescine transport system permease protein